MNKIQLTSADLRPGETESGLRRRRIRRRAQQRRSLTDPRPPPNDEELRWKSRQRYSDDSGSESDDEQLQQQANGSRYHTHRAAQNPISHFDANLTPSHLGAAPQSVATAGGGLNNNINTIQLEPIKLNQEIMAEPGRSQSTLSNLGTESSGQKDSGFSDLLARSEEDTLRTATVRRQHDYNDDGDQIERPDTNEELLPSLNRSSTSLKNQSPLMTADDDESNRKRTFLLRRTKSERRAENPTSSNQASATTERIKYKADIPISVIRAAQAKTRKYKKETNGSIKLIQSIEIFFFQNSGTIWRGKYSSNYST